MARQPRRADEVVAVAAALLGPVASVEHMPVGFGNENWRVVTVSGDDVVVKFGPAEFEEKWRAARRSLDLAAAAGVPVVPCRDFTRHGDGVVRVFDWVEGVSPIDLSAPAALHCAAELGQAVARLHGIDIGHFGSRLDASSPSFERWEDYLRFRLEGVRRRCREQQAMAETELDEVSRAIIELAAAVTQSARPTLCHRDLHAGNVLADQGGRLVALLDFDMAEAWDAPGEWFKLNRMLFPSLGPGSADAFWASYRDGADRPDRWDERVLVVDLMEGLNLIANARAAGWDAPFEAAARGWVAESLTAADQLRR